MEKFPELQQIIGRRNSVKTTVIVSAILLIIIAISTVIFLILNGYILVKSPTSEPAPGTA
jgi:hypothetical protein